VLPAPHPGKEKLDTIPAVSFIPSVISENPYRPEEIWAAVGSFQRWLGAVGYASWDPYDIWGTAYGLFSRRMYYRHPALGLPLIAPILAMEVIYPRWRKWFVDQERFATADGQLILAFANLYQLTGNDVHLQKALDLARDLLRYSIPGYSGPCWGYPFDWQHHRGLWKKNTPFITATPYCFEAYLKLFDLTGNESFFGTAKSIAQFVQHDLHNTPTSADAAAGSYSPTDHSQVINASAYRAMVLFEAADRFGQPASLESARQNLNFILQSQQVDGSWPYALDHGSERFIDHFHTCFVLKNLAKLNRRLGSGDVTGAIRKGFDYYRRELFGPDGLPRSFAVKPRTQIVRLEMYDFAEAITLGAVLRDEIPEAFALAHKLARIVCQQYQLPDGHFVTRVYIGGIRHTLPYLRWPQAQMFHALTNLLVAISGQTAPGAAAASNPAEKK